MIEIIGTREATKREKAHRILDLYFDAGEHVDDYISIEFDTFSHELQMWAMKGPFDKKKKYVASINGDYEKIADYLEALVNGKESQETGTSGDSGTE